MDPCPFVRILVGNLALKFQVPTTTRTKLSRTQDPCFSCYCKIKLNNFPHQVATTPLIQSQQDIAACFSLSKSQICLWGSSYKLSVEVYVDGNGGSACGLASEKLLGKFSVALDLHGAESRPCVLHDGSVPIGRNRSDKNGSCMQLCLTVRTEPDPRFVFQFGGDPECSPQVFQVQGSFKQAVFTCKFGIRSSLSESNRSRNWLSRLNSDKDKFSKERKGWSVTIHDLSGSPVAMASMVTPFVPSPGSDRGRLEAWREPGFTDALGYRVDLFYNDTATTVATSTLNTKLGGKFTMDIMTTNMATPTRTPMISPQSSCDFGSLGSRSGSRPGSGSGSDFGFGVLSIPLQSSSGFVMSSTVEGAGKCSKPEVEVGVKHVTCTEDAAAFVALAAAVDLSMDACRPFSQKLRKELRQQTQSFVV
ncbi:hypothetical protein like AT3G19680 [Hibiscus trionum]|uniref:Uncharacterized protein n=1 Tax=Hibiscus trionum TaxID=183268 RepID=A0A9W7ML56_HIBTR|nr:hypothetical protein like AT3G19680 [Hibiscus trionum]